MERMEHLEKELEKSVGEIIIDLQREIRELEEENKKLKEELEQYKKMFEDQLKEVYIKNTAKFLDKKFPKINGFMEEDTLQELRDLGEI